ncbi:MAG TPA: hybrid sensor histidine kinase/response regulator, partial [candidate division Zixibacteria bacterium]|nr:hybrid sensor histidine kinase/response regulator [candidate division Zixibacteria bacterium]
MFQPFFSTKRQGTGLGLAIVHGVCTALKIGLAVDSAPGRGATVTLEFPVCMPRPQLQGAATASAAPAAVR